MKNDPDFYITAAGDAIGDLATLRACWSKARLRDESGDNHMLIEIAPAIIGQTYGLGGHDITEVIISARYRGSTLFPINEWPCHVYVARALDQSITQMMVFTKEQVEVIAWAKLFRTVEEAGGQRKESPYHAS